MLIFVWYLQLAEVANTLAGMQPEIMAQLVPLERKLGLVVTLFRVRRIKRIQYGKSDLKKPDAVVLFPYYMQASVWATYMANEQQDQDQP